jgi:hypothetical protein
MGSELGITADSKPVADYSPVSIWWATWAAVWTVAVSLGMAYLIVRRDTPVLRIRSLGLSLSAIVLLHLYYTSVQFGTMMGALMPGDAQYWIMGTYLPCGMALFYGSNTYFLHVAKLQKRFAPYGSRSGDAPSSNRGGFIGRFRRLAYTTRVVILVGIAMAIQVHPLDIIMAILSNRSALPHRPDVVDLEKVPQLLGHPRHRSPRSPYGPKGGAGPWLGMVARRALAGLLVLDRCSYHSLEVA